MTCNNCGSNNLIQGPFNIYCGDCGANSIE